MPKSYKGCDAKGCPAIVETGRRYCIDHQRQQYKQRDAVKTEARYSTAYWQRLRASALAREPLCRECARHGAVTAAQVVDHITPIQDGGTDALDNLQALCQSCHNAKTRRESNERIRSARGDNGSALYLVS